METAPVTCPRCYGRGYFSAFAHVEGGRCFECGGAGKVEASTVAPARDVRPGLDAIDALRGLYRAGRSRVGAERADWCESIAEPLDAYGPHSILSGARALLARIEADDAAQASKIREAFRGLGVEL